MSTSKKTISTISYNTRGFLNDRLSSMYDSGLLRTYAFIRHWGEASPFYDTEEKDHYHVFVEPNEPIDWVAFRNKFDEPCKAEKPLRCQPVRPSKVEDWLLYSLHYKAYLLSKGIIKKFSYSLSELVTPDEDYFQDIYLEACSKYDKYRMALIAVQSGCSLQELVSYGFCTPRNAYLFTQLIREYHSGEFIHSRKNESVTGTFVVDSDSVNSDSFTEPDFFTDLDNDNSIPF